MWWKPMNKMLTYLFIILLPVLVLAAQERDPFAPYMWDQPSTPGSNVGSAPEVGEDEVVNPLLRGPLSSFRLTGLMVAPHDAIAVLKGRDKVDYFVTVGDTVGIEKGIVESISRKGVVVNMDGDFITLSVQNSFELQNDSL